jgi:hypothetical protein
MLVLQGCFYNRPDYPEGWEKLATDSGCPDLKGWYSDKGRTYAGVRYKPSIYLMLLGGMVKKMDDVELIQIMQSDEEVLIKAYAANKSILEERSFRFASSNCRNGFLILDVPDTEEFESREGAVAYGWEGHALARARDGALILRIDSGAVGFVVAVPIAGKDRIWGRFEPVSP